jgi:sarcosine oxidase
VVVGAGAWGLPAAAELAGRGHEVTLVDRYGVGNLLSSSAGPTRIWRVTHPDARRVRLAQRAIEAWRSVESRTGRTLLVRRGLLWRDHVTQQAILAALAAEGAEHTEVAAADVGDFVPGLRPDGRDAVWTGQAGPLLAAESLAAHEQLFAAAGGRLAIAEVRAVSTGEHGVRLELADGSTLPADVVVLAPGPAAGPLLAGLGVELALRPHLEQVVHFGPPQDPAAHDHLPCLFDGPTDTEPGLYALATPGRGYKVGLDFPVRELAAGDLDRSADEALLAATVARVRRDLGSVHPNVLDVQQCCWTDSPDGRFVLDRLPAGVVVACGDSGEGFKFSALMGPLLADLAEDRPVDADVAAFGLARLAGGVAPAGRHVVGR